MRNAWDLFDEIRNNLNEASAEHWEDLEILRKLNQTQRKLYMLMNMTPGDWFLKKSSALSPSNGLITIPSDCAKPVYIEDAVQGTELPFSTTVRNRRVSRLPGTTLGSGTPEVYMLQSQIEINADSYSNNVYLWYVKRIADMHFGTAGSASGSNSLEFDSSNYPHRTDDYYNDLTVEIVSGTGDGTVATISDYVGSTRVATVSGTFDTDSVYGTVSELPDEADEVLVWETSFKCLSKPSSTIDTNVWSFFKEQTNDAREIFNDWISTRIVASRRTEMTEYEG